jgi:hypothetical protein
MARKSRLSENAFDGVKEALGSTAKGISKSPAKKKTATSKKRASTIKKTSQEKSKPKKRNIAKGEDRRVIFVKYNKKDGRIIESTETTTSENKKTGNQPFLEVSKNEGVEEIILNDDLSNIDLIDIHLQYEVSKRGKMVHLVLRDK